MAKDKVPGLDSFPPLFFKRFWLIIQAKVVQAVMEFFATRKISLAWKRTFVTLVPKRLGATKPSHYRPISLYTTLYKIYAKR